MTPDTNTNSKLQSPTDVTHALSNDPGLRLTTWLHPSFVLEATQIRRQSPYLRSRTKRAMDITCALVGILMTPLVLLPIAITICAVDGAPVFYRQRRVGLLGRKFWIIKFRTMRRDADQILRSNPELLEEFARNGFKLDDDPRLIPFGGLLRKLSLDELPQFFNVLKGDMSIVGPRPVLAEEVMLLYGTDSPAYLATKPGCAGLWQCSGRSDTTYDTRIALDKEYVENASLKLDISIVLRTFWSLVRRKGAK